MCWFEYVPIAIVIMFVCTHGSVVEHFTLPTTGLAYIIQHSWLAKERKDLSVFSRSCF